MEEELRTVSLQNLPDAIRLLNETSRGTALELHLDLFSFLALAQYWNFSHEYSLISYVDSEPAAIIITCTDAQARDAYTFYWGALPKFRSLKTARALFEACCHKLYDGGYLMLYGVSAPDRPARRYRFIKVDAPHELVAMESQSPSVPVAEPALEVRRIDVEAISQITFSPDEPFCWYQRKSFFRKLGSSLHVLGAFSGDAIKAYTVAFARSEGTNLLDLRSPASDLAGGSALLRYLGEQDYRPPFTATDVFRNSYTQRLLAAAGFVVIREFATLTRDLRATCSAEKLKA